MQSFIPLSLYGFAWLWWSVTNIGLVWNAPLQLHLIYSSAAARGHRARPFGYTTWLAHPQGKHLWPARTMKRESEYVKGNHDNSHISRALTCCVVHEYCSCVQTTWSKISINVWSLSDSRLDIERCAVMTKYPPTSSKLVLMFRTSSGKSLIPLFIGKGKMLERLEPRAINLARWFISAH